MAKATNVACCGTDVTPSHLCVKQIVCKCQFQLSRSSVSKFQSDFSFGQS